MTRPAGEIRQALRHAVEQVHPAHFRELAGHVPGINPRSPSEMERVRTTLRDMAQAGELDRVGRASVAGACRPLTLYAPRRRGGWVTQGAALGCVLQSWIKG